MTHELREQGASEEDIELATAGTRALVADLVWDRDFHDRLRAEGVCAVPYYPPEERGKALIAIRIARGLTQKDLADALGVSQAQVSRDEKNDYHGITQERHARVLTALGVEEHVAGYSVRKPVIIEMPTIELEAASFAPDYDHRFAVTPTSEEA